MLLRNNLSNVTRTMLVAYWCKSGRNRRWKANNRLLATYCSSMIRSWASQTVAKITAATSTMESTRWRGTILRRRTYMQAQALIVPALGWSQAQPLIPSILRMENSTSRAQDLMDAQDSSWVKNLTSVATTEQIRATAARWTTTKTTS